MQEVAPQAQPHTANEPGSSRPVNVLMICALDVWSMGDGKGAASFYRTLRAFNDAGHTVHLIAPDRGGPNGASGAAVETMASLENVKLQPVPYPRSSKPKRGARNLLERAWDKLQLTVLFPLSAAREGWRVLRRERVDVLYGYEVHGVLAVSLLRRLRALPLVARFQGTILEPTAQSPLRLARKLEHILALKAPADLYIMTDDGTLGDVTIRRLNPRSRRRLRFWRNGIDLEWLRPIGRQEATQARQRLGIPPDAPVVITVSRLVWWKRLDRAIRVWPQVIRQRGDAHLVIVGDGEERARLGKMVRQLGVESTVRLAGAVQRDEVVNYLHAADIFVSVNDLSNAGNPLMEAAACGKAVVTLNNGATSRLIEDGVTGILLEPDDDAALAGAIIRLIEDQPLRERLQQQARRFATDHFWSWDERMAAEIQAVSEMVRPAQR